MAKNIEVITKKLENRCYCCDESIRGKPILRKDCKTCNGTGIYTENHYIFVVGKIAIDGDTLK